MSSISSSMSSCSSSKSRIRSHETDIVTLNIDGVSYAQTGSSKGRFARVVKLISFLLLFFGIVALQETNLLSGAELKALSNSFEGCDITGSCKENTGQATAGVAIITSPKICRDYSVVPYEPGGAGKGRIISVKYTPKNLNSHLDSFRVTNIYLQSGNSKSNNRAKKAQLDMISTIPKDTTYEYIGGDFNISADRAKDAKLEKYLQKKMQKNSMEEVAQQENTCYRKEGDEVTSSKIDRWFSNHTITQAAALTQTATVVSNSPYTVGQYRSGKKMKTVKYIPSRKDVTGTHITDHMPVGIRVRATNSKKPVGTVFDKKIVNSDIFKQTVSERWADYIMVNEETYRRVPTT